MFEVFRKLFLELKSFWDVRENQKIFETFHDNFRLHANDTTPINAILFFHGKFFIQVRNGRICKRLDQEDVGHISHDI